MLVRYEVKVTSYDVANTLALACFVVACFRARWVALALLPPVALILARTAGLVDTSSASHPLRWAVPVAGALLAAWAAYIEARGQTMWLILAPKKGPYRSPPRPNLRVPIPWPPNKRVITAALLVFGSDCADLPGLLLWRLPGDWVVIPLQIAACASILAVLLVPERWLMKWA
jgi:hypothetical protein